MPHLGLVTELLAIKPIGKYSLLSVSEHASFQPPTVTCPVVFFFPPDSSPPVVASVPGTLTVILAPQEVSNVSVVVTCPEYSIFSPHLHANGEPIDSHLSFTDENVASSSSILKTFVVVV